MRKLKCNNEASHEVKYKALRCVIVASVMRAFGEILIWRKNRNNKNNMIDELLKLSNKREKIIFDKKIIFNDYSTSNLVKRITKIYKEEEKNYKGLVKKEVSKIVHKYIKSLEDDAMNFYLTNYRTYTMHDCFEIKEMVRDYCRIIISINNFIKLFNVEEEMDKNIKTFITISNNWSKKIHNDIVGA